MSPADGSFLRTASEILSDPDVQAAQQRERVRLGIAHSEASRSSGVCFSGMGPDPIRVKTDDELVAEVLTKRAKREAWLTSPRGRFVTALNALDEIGYVAEAYEARAAYYRGFQDDRQPASVGEVAIALRALNEVPGSDARTARGCLSELLLAVHARRAA